MLSMNFIGKMDGILFKIDFEKTYDKVNWAFFAASIADERV
jgi:hypothetical protein